MALFTLRATLLSQLFRFRKSDRTLVDWPRASTFLEKNLSKDESQNLLKSMNNDFQVMSSIKKLHFYAVHFLCLSKYKRMLMKSNSDLSKELDLKKFLHRQRLQSIATLGMLNGR